MENHEERKILTKKEVSKKLKISLSSVCRLMKAGKLTAYRMNPPVGKVFFYEDEVLQALTSTTKAS